MNGLLKTIGGVASASLLLVACQQNSTKTFTAEEKAIIAAPNHNLNTYYGDLHNHCNLTYAHGDMRSAFEAAREQLDFVSVTPHALWPDIPGENEPGLGWVIAYHTGAFVRLRQGGYNQYVAMNKEYNEEGKFLSFLGYEIHSMKHGDHVALNYDLDAPLLECTSVDDLKDQLKGKKAYVTPHHMGYQEGFRGYDWDYFDEGIQTPFVEIFSRHGLAESDQGDYNYLHDMGPRVYGGSALAGLEAGNKFGLMASTDQHAGYPGSYGDGRIAVLAESLTRDAIWEALGKRHIYALTGDKIGLDFRINEAIMGDEISGSKREITLNVEAQNYIDYVDIVKNGRRFAHIGGPLDTKIPEGDVVRAKVKINFGWNRLEAPVKWDNVVSITEGKILAVQPCFRGLPFTAPQEGQHVDEKTNVNRILSQDEKSVSMELYTVKNPNVLTPAMQGVILDVEMPKSAYVKVKANGHDFGYTLEELFGGTKAHFLNGWLSESVQFERACPEDGFMVSYTFTDTEPERDTDYYYVRVRQRDGQAAWSSPIWVNR